MSDELKLICMDKEFVIEELHRVIDIADERLLKMMYAVACAYNNQECEYVLSIEEVAELDRRVSNRLSGKSETYTWKEVKSKLLSKKK